MSEAHGAGNKLKPHASACGIGSTTPIGRIAVVLHITVIFATITIINTIFSSKICHISNF